jgi:hypothetical protein
MVSTLDEFLFLVSRMRDAQRNYFRNRSIGNLNAAKNLEKQVDREIEQWEEQQIRNAGGAE